MSGFVRSGPPLQQLRCRILRRKGRVQRPSSSISFRPWSIVALRRRRRRGRSELRTRRARAGRLRGSGNAGSPCRAFTLHHTLPGVLAALRPLARRHWPTQPKGPSKQTGSGRRIATRARARAAAVSARVACGLFPASSAPPQRRRAGRPGGSAVGSASCICGSWRRPAPGSKRLAAPAPAAAPARRPASTWGVPAAPSPFTIAVAGVPQCRLRLRPPARHHLPTQPTGKGPSKQLGSGRRLAPRARARAAAAVSARVACGLFPARSVSPQRQARRQRRRHCGSWSRPYIYYNLLYIYSYNLSNNYIYNIIIIKIIYIIIIMIM